MLEKLLLLAAAAVDIKLQTHVLVGVCAAYVFHQAVMRLKNTVDLSADLFSTGAGYLVAVQQQFDIESFFHVTKKEEREENEAGGEDRGHIEATTGGHADRSDHKKRSCGGQAGSQTARVKDGTGADETDPGNNLSGDPSRIGGDARELLRENREQGCAETNKHVGAQAGSAMFELAFQANDSAENGRQRYAGERTADDSARHFSAEQIDEVLPGHGVTCVRGSRLPLPDFNIGHDGNRVTGVITGRDKEWQAPGRKREFQPKPASDGLGQLAKPGLPERRRHN